jgi:hypothetical protein
MNVLKPHLQATVKTLLGKGIRQREINRKTSVDRKTIRKYGRLDVWGIFKWPSGSTDRDFKSNLKV